MNAIDKLIQHITQTRYQDLPDSTLSAVKTFVLDSVGVGLSGSRVPYVKQVKQAASEWGADQQAQVWTSGEWVSASTAAFINGYQIHNQEWDCVHEPAVVHPMAVILSALVAYAQKYNLSGKQVMLGVAVAVDVATLIGESATSGLKFFRPSICGCLGATAGMCAMQTFSAAKTANALGIAYSQISGTMQAHVEGSPMLALQIGLNAQAAIRAIDLAEAGFDGPKDILEGPYGYFANFEDSYDINILTTKLGKGYQIEQVSHKPFPTGRAGHGTADGLLILQNTHGFKAQDVAIIKVRATPLINRLVGRPVKDDMDVSYAKLCNGYIAATALLTGNVTVEDFDLACLQDPERLALARKVSTELNGCCDPNALAPVNVTVELYNSQTLQIDLPAVLGNPLRPMSREAQLEKFRAACRSAVVPFSAPRIDKLIKSIDELEQIQNINQLVELMVNDPQRPN